MSFQPLRRILSTTLRNSPIAAELQIARVFEIFAAAVQAIWGEERAKFIHPVSFKDGVLKLESTSAAAKQQLALDSLHLRNEINRRLGEALVKQISVRAKGF